MMPVDQCSLVTGLFLGAMVMALLLLGYNRQKEARAQMKKLAGEKKKADEALKKAQAEHSKGCAALPAAYLLIVLGLALLVLLVYLLSSGQV